EVDEVAAAGVRERLFEREVQELDAAERAAGGRQRLGMVEARVGVAAEGHVEAAGAVHPPEAVEAGLVQVDEARRALGGGEPLRVEGADGLEVVLLVDV